ncbi:MAG: hypothetical protein COU33_02630 [Candidatus Magasanikbacteria bacterium CG10_big_fil_rev_8_21_14_0_10_43_6]|uniref:Sporulation stage II protein D amidase enhancer LytB N-terminal domain-containing protein n=1 Tax=Candidatus Magasanikbacteria bacterium CG10_big_fil_rev_8_21_14_0_10_43_6 TaxID=1974650 RepID=A0A2M6W160_9BACT|nr:MAG: hypothetical protein COU33_02630 [Candidatus Magasanikbacteria bacterium CG10_big_fil_rev_8_21_14_0_10_43_6]
MALKKIYSIVLFAIGVTCVLPHAAYAGDPTLPINDRSYAARYVSQSIPDPIVIEAGDTRVVDIRFKNIGTAPWSENGSHYISAYTVEPKYRNSEFAGSAWLSPRQTGKVSGTVQPGETGTISIALTAPQTPGVYIERFYLAAENRTWVSGGYFYVKVQVAPKTEKTPTVGEKTETIESAPAAALKAKKIGQNKKSISVVGGESVSLVLIYQNNGAAAWDGYALRASSPTGLASIQKLSFADIKWQSDVLVDSSPETIEPGIVVRKRFTFRAPVEKGVYTASFHLVADGGEMIEGSEAVVSVDVTANAPAQYVAPTFRATPSQSEVAVPSNTYRLAAEPRIRVGVWNVDVGYVLFQSTQDDYDIFTGAIYQGTLPVHTQATLSRKNGQYSLQAEDISIKSPEYIRLIPKKNQHAVFSLLNYERNVGWKGPRNFNTYRGAMEYRLTDDGNDNIYVINDLLFEDYVMGIGENVDSSPVEYLKSQATAQRTYAYYISGTDKHENRFFDVKATTADQLYLGYENERIMPNFVDAVQATRGYMATYDIDANRDTPNEVVITPYFGHTGGRTNSWAEVWGGHKPWLVSVKTEYDAARWSSDYGHGVGMSQADAAMRAKEEGLDWQTLFKYYYTGVDLERWYK